MKLQQSARIAVEECLNVKRDETVLVITDEPCRPVGYALWEAAKSVCREAIIAEITPRIVSGTEPPPGIAKLMLEADVVIIPTSKSLSHTKARRDACKAGARVATLPGITEDCLTRMMGINWSKLATLTKRVARLLTDGSQVTITTISGTQLTFSIKGRDGFADTGQLGGRGIFGNLPAGEGYIAPIEGTAKGRLVVEGSFAGIGVLKRPLKLTVDQGYVTKITGGEEAGRLEKLLAPHGKLARNIAEFGIGTHDKAKITGNILEDEKIKGTIHIALGNNASMGGVVHVPIHLDGVVLKPTVTIDGRMVLKHGQLLV